MAGTGLYDPAMRRLWAVAALALAGCGAKHHAAPDPRCTEPAVIVRVASGSSGPRISDCVRAATGDIDLQNVGSAISAAADDLAARHQPRALGFLIGATRRGTSTAGVQSELVNRVEAVARRMASTDDGAVSQGVADGEAHG